MQPKIYIGCSGWSYKDWTDVFYPKNLSTRDYLSHYVRFFNTVEINNTFYNFPTEKAVQSWELQAPSGFKYSLKANKSITHINHFKNVQELLKRLYGLSDILAEKTGCFLFQFPPSFPFTPEALENLITQLDNRYHNVVEFRHKSWWNSSVIQAFHTSNIGFCSVNGFKLPEDLIAINKRAYLRLHGDPPYSSLYSYQELSSLIQKINSSSLDEVWIYFNNTKKAYAVQNALQLKRYINE
ncbi:MAG: DUF72 domain-containing protein [Alphaproteobacteria bacterium]|nr:DUF72 domain-containing protein [Alphaproteobacteria bacterium]